MINSANKNYSFVAISKGRKSKKRQMNSTLFRILSPKKTLYHRKNQDYELNLSYVSPNSQEFNTFKSKLSSILDRGSLHQKLVPKSHPKKALHSMTETFKSEGRSQNSLATKWYEVNETKKKKSIRQYISQISQDKKKKSENKTEQLDLQAINSQQQIRHSNPILIINKFKHKDVSRQIQKQHNSVFRDRQVPIHHTQVYYFSKKKVRTEPIEISLDLVKIQKKQKRKVTISRIFKLREEINLKQGQKQAQRLKSNNEVLIINEIHPTVAIITTRKPEINQQSSAGERERELRVSKRSIDVGRTQKQEEEISPWKRKNQQEFQLY